VVAESEAGRLLRAGRLRLAPVARPVCPDPGQPGRQLALAYAPGGQLDSLRSRRMVVVCTDGAPDGRGRTVVRCLLVPWWQWASPAQAAAWTYVDRDHPVRSLPYDRLEVRT
jgi:hypothetical protein